MCGRYTCSYADIDGENVFFTQLKHILNTSIKSIYKKACGMEKNMLEIADIIDVAGKEGTPAYIFDLDVLKERMEKLQSVLGEDVNLCFSCTCHERTCSKV